MLTTNTAKNVKHTTAIVRKTGTFIRQYSDFMKPEFRFDIKDKYSYFLLTDDFINSKQMVLSYVKHITDHLF